jgi:hypothetical protein
MFRFSIRDVLWLMVVVGLAVMLWAERIQNIGLTQQRDATESERSALRLILRKEVSAEVVSATRDSQGHYIITLKDAEQGQPIGTIPPNY